MRKAFNFYRSYWEVANELNDTDRLAFYDALLTRQFTGKEIELKGLVKFAYLSQKHSIDKQIKGYEDKTKNTLNYPIEDPTQGGTQGGKVDPSVQEKEKEKEKEKYIYRGFKHLSISIDEFNKLCIDYTKQQVDDILDQIENNANNKKYSSLYLTAKNWLNRNQSKQTEEVSPEELKAIKLGFLKPKQ
jgi:hypothetical protein